MEAYPGSVAYLRAVKEAGLPRAVVSSSANCRDVLVAAGIEDMFDARIDGVVAEQQHLPREAGPGHVPGRSEGPRARADRRATVFEDALAGV